MELDLTILLFVASLGVLLIAVLHTSTQKHNAEVDRKLKRIMDHLGIRESDIDMSQVEALAREGKIVEAVRLHRKLTGSSLKEAKQAVDRLTG